MSLVLPVSIRAGLFQIIDEPVPHVVQIQRHWDRTEAADCRLYVELPPNHAVCLKRPNIIAASAWCAASGHQFSMWLMVSAFPPQSRHCGHGDAGLPHLCSKA